MYGYKTATITENEEERQRKVEEQVATNFGNVEIQKLQMRSSLL